MAEVEAFGRLLPLHTHAMLRAATALLGKPDGEDAAQEALLRAWQAWPSLQQEGSLRPWLLRITVNVCLQWKRGQHGKYARMTQELPDDDEGWLSSLSNDPGTSEHAGTMDLRTAVDQLPHDMRVAVVLRYYGGMDASEIGEALAVPSATIRTRLRRGLMELRGRLAERTAISLSHPSERSQYVG